MISEKVKTKRLNLSVLSCELRPMVKMGLYPSINRALEDHYKNQTGCTSFNTFMGWKEKGFTVKKGSKAFVIWGTPVGSKIDPDPEMEEGSEKDNFSFFPLCHLFSDLQVQAVAPVLEVLCEV